MLRKRYLVTVLMLFMVLSLIASNLLVRHPGEFTIYFLDLEVSETAEDKSGDATILISPNGEVMLLDCGHPESAPQVLAALNALGIEEIDIFVASHPHIDHIGAFPSIAASYPIHQIYRSALEYPTNTNQASLMAAEAYKIPTTILAEGDSFSFGEEIEVTVFNPPIEIVYPKNFPDNSTQFVNNHSLALQFKFGSSTAWFSGDLYMIQERKLTQKYGDAIQSDVAKANHHGGDTSNSLRWIRTLDADIVVAMHDQLDSMTVYNNYKKYGAEYHLTLNDGLVKVVMDDDKHYQVFDTKESWMN